MGIKAIKLQQVHVTNIQQTVRTRNVNNCVIMHNGRDGMVNFEPSEYMRNMIFQSVTQAARKKKI